jgi:hypothetical protein
MRLCWQARGKLAGPPTDSGLTVIVNWPELLKEGK